MDAWLAEQIAKLYGKQPVSFARIQRGYTPAERWRVHFADGSSAFAKVGKTLATAKWLRAEQAAYRQLQANCMPRCLGVLEPGDRPILLLEDLSELHWPPPWGSNDAARVLHALGELAETRPPSGLPDLESDRRELAGWLTVERNPKPFLSLGLCSSAWLEEALPTLLMAQDLATLTGDELVHGEMRAHNVCLGAERVVFVDWHKARRGNAAFDRVSLAPSLRLEGGPPPEEVAPGEAVLAALWAGHLAASAGLPPLPDTPRLRGVQLRQLRIAMPWVARSLGLVPLDRPWAREACARLDAGLARGEIDEEAWFAGTEEVIGDLYLGSADPRGQSGKSGDEVEWRWSRELVLDALPRSAGPRHVLDVGCANGYLMESLVGWGKQRGLTLEPHGLEISSRLAGLARQRQPQWAERIAIGNVLTWTPPRRYDLVHTGLDYVPPGRRRELLQRLLGEFLAPGGRLVLRAERVGEGQPDLAEQVRSLGLEIGGVIESVHPGTGALRRTIWLGA